MADIHLTGLVLSEKGDSLVGATVRLLTPGNEVVGYAITDARSQYKISIKEFVRDSLQLSFSCLGYEKLTLNVDRKNCDKPMRIILKEKPFKIKEVVVKAPPIKAIGDTILYNVASFVSKADRNIEDVIKRLPGIQVEESGQIFYNGEAINKFYIEGLDLLGGRYSIAKKNINPNDISSVSVYENHQPKRVLKDLKISDRAALNLTLKNKKKLIPVGYTKVGAGYGKEINWLGELFGMLISPNHQTILTGKGNNSGISYGNEMRSFIERFDTETLAYGIFPSIPFGEAQIPRSRYFRNKSATASFNTIYKIKKDITFSAFADYTKEADDFSNSVVTDYYATGETPVRISEKNHSKLNSQETNVRFKVENNAPTLYLGNELSFKGRFNDHLHRLDKINILEQSLNNADFNVYNHFNTIIRTPKNVYEVKSLVSVSNTPRNYIEALIPGSDSMIVKQVAEGLSFYTLESTSFGWFLNAYSNLGVNVSFEAFYDKFNSFNTRGSEEKENSNKDDGYKIITSLEPYYQLKKGLLTWRTEFPFRMYNIRYNRFYEDKKHDLNRPFLDFRSNLNFPLFTNIKTSVTVGQKHTLGGINDFITNPVYTTYRQQHIMGTGDFTIRTNRYITASASYRNTLEGLFWTLRASYNRMKNNRIAMTNASSDQTVVGNRKGKNKGSNVDVYLNISKNIKDWNTTVSLDGGSMYMKRTTFRQDNLFNIKNQMYNIGTDIQSRFFEDRLSTSLNGRYTRTIQSSEMADSFLALDDILVTFNLSVFPFPKFIFYYKLYYNRSDLTKSEHTNSVFMDGGFRYKFNKFEFELAGKNLTNKKVYAYNQLSNYDRYSYSFNLRPIEFLLSFKYDF